VTTGKFACIGWGSLVTDWGELPCDGVWRNDGPALPLEFARESLGGRITLVICANAALVRTYWTELSVTTLAAARNALGKREYAASSPSWIADYIGYFEEDSQTGHGAGLEAIRAWVASKSLSGAVWTNLPVGFRVSRGTMPSAEDIASYFELLSAEDRNTALKYVRMAPTQTDTEFRRLLDAKYPAD
jgi:hypothetical protein